MKTCSTRPSNHSTSLVYPDDNSNSSHDSCEMKPKHTNNNHIIKHNYNMQPSSSKIFFEDDKPVFTPGKLADETQMGSLNSLMNCQDKNDDGTEKSIDASNIQTNIDEEATAKRTHLSCKTVPLPPFKKRRFFENSFSDNNSEINKTVEDEKDCEIKNESTKMQRLQDELSETSRHFKLLNSSSESSSVDDFHCENKISPKLYCKKEESSNDCDNNDSYQNSSVKSSCLKTNNIFEHYFDEAKDSLENNYEKSDHTRNGRSCKGKRYREFMNTGGLIVNKRSKKDHDDNKKPDADDCILATTDKKEKNKQIEPLPYENMSLSYMEKKKLPKSACKNRSEKVIDNTSSNEIGNKPFVVPDFDLAAKIEELPSLNFEEFLERKKENKKRKNGTKLKEPKFEIARNNNLLNNKQNPSSIDTDNKEPIENNYDYDLKREDRLKLAKEYKNSFTGSKKRKPKKISITRLNIDSQITNKNPENLNAINNCTNTVEPTSTPIMTDQIPVNQFDMSALNTLAEVASNLL